MNKKRVLIKVVFMAVAALAILWANRGREGAARQAAPRPARPGGEFVVTQTRRPDGTIVRTGQFTGGPAPAAPVVPIVPAPGAAPASPTSSPAQPALASTQPAQPAPAAACDRLVVRVADGDTVILDRNEKVRLLGVDTPEKFESDKLAKQAAKLQVDARAIARLGQRSTEFTEKRCAGKRCRLVLDGRPKDDYGRTLGYVYLEDGSCLNRELIENGYATVYKWFPYSRRDEFLRLENEARQGNRGLWAEPLFRRLSGE